jgi:hypothetical protein
LIILEDDIALVKGLACYKWHARRIRLALSWHIRVPVFGIPLWVRKHIGLFMEVIISWTGWRLMRRRGARRGLFRAIMMHGTQGFASALEEAQKVSLRKPFPGLGICVYCVL